MIAYEAAQYQRLLHYIWREMSLWGADHRSPTFPASFVIKLVVTQGTSRYQMKDLDMFFQQIPLALVYCRSSGTDTTSSQSQAFFPKS